MQNPPGTFIVIEGSDGSGKTTQFKLLAERLKAVGYDIEIFKFPQYEEPSSHFIRTYLAGGYGPASTISPYTASLFYAMDRYEGTPKLRKALDAGKVVLCDRYVGANMAHQGSKFENEVEQHSFFVWEDSLEFQLLGIPRPNINIILRVPAEVSQKLIKTRALKTGIAMDEHEKDVSHLAKSVATYDALCTLFPKDFKAIECIEDGRLLSIPAVNDLIWETIKPLLPPKPKHPGHGVTVRLNDKPDNKAKPQKKEPATEHPDGLEQLKTDLNGFSYLALNSLRTLGGSLELNIKSNWSHRRGYAYYTPGELTPQLTKVYKTSLKKQADRHNQLEKILFKFTSGKSEVIKQQAQAALEAIIPMSATTNATLVTTKTNVGKILEGLVTANQTELRRLAETLQAAANKRWPTDFTKKSSEAPLSVPQPISQIIAQLAGGSLAAPTSESGSTIKLLDARPRNELDLLPDCLYPYTSLPGVEIADEIDKWSYDQKAKTFKAAVLGNSPALAQATYKFDCIGTQEQLAELTQAKLATNLQLQALTPRYGYEVPEILEQVGGEDLFLACFDESLSLFSKLQSQSLDKLAPYATLQGHKLRWQFMINAAGLAAANKSAFVNSLVAKLVEFHPLIYEALQSPKQSEPQKSKKVV